MRTPRPSPNPRTWALALAFSVVGGCSSEQPVPTDAAVRPDAPVTEAGLVFVDATPATSTDASLSPSDASASSCGGACDPRSASDCVEATCALAAGTSACVAKTGELGEGEACTGAADCAAGLACFSDGYSGTCGRVCCADSASADTSACEDDETCVSATAIDGTTTSWGRCTTARTCTLLADVSGCETGEGCYVVDWAGTTRCLSAGRATTGQTCAASNDCEPGLVCVGAIERTCLALCAVSTGRPCGATASCVRQSYTPEGIGVCVEGT